MARGARIEKVILAREYHELLWGTPTGRLLRGAIPYLSGARLRHDDHYHVDFANPDRQDGASCTGDAE